MKDDIKNLREITQLVLKDIYVTDELKNKTLELCKNKKSNIFKPFLAAASSAAVIAISLTGYQYFSHKVDNNLNDKQTTHNQNNISSNSSANSKEKAFDSTTINQDKKQQIAYDNTKDKHLTNSKSNITQSTNTNLSPSNTQDKKAPIASSNSVQTDSGVEPTANNNVSTVDTASQVQTSKEIQPNTDITSTPATRNSPIDKSSNAILTSGANPTISTSSDTVSTAEAEKYWGSKLVMPSYIPNSFELTNISTPNDTKEIYVKLTYSSKNNYFKITQNKNTTYTITGKPIVINGINGTIAQSKDDTNSNTTITQIIWIKDNIQYSIVGNISDMELTKISKSVN